jgi:hypothetical protein
MIESQGMIFTEAVDCNNNQLTLQPGKDLVIMVPTDTILEDAKIFRGDRQHEEMNWTVDNNAELSAFTLDEIVQCGGWLCVYKRGLPCEPCDFFFCGLKKLPGQFFRSFSKKGRAENKQYRECMEKLRAAEDSALVTRSTNNGTVVESRPPIAPALKPKCKALEDLFKKYGVDNLEDLVLAVNKPLLDKYKVKTMDALQDTLYKVNLARIEVNYVDKKISYEDLNYYIYNTPALGWTNVDKFADLSRLALVTMKVDIKPGPDIDCKLVFVDRRSVLPATQADKKYEFKGVPRGEEVYIVAIKLENGAPYLAMKKVHIEGKVFEIEWKSVSLEELKQQLELLDAGDTRNR